MAKTPRTAVAAETTPGVDAGEPRTVRLFRLQDRFTTPLMSETEAGETLAGYPGEYERVAEPVEAPAPAEEAPSDGD